MEPGLRDRGHPHRTEINLPGLPAAMEPGLRDRGHEIEQLLVQWKAARPQWSPVFATGVTRTR